ncbi:MAG: electron transport complex subunit E [Defluviitaleaceae bacterium]|nr:electron transport complex subunit E [Defluviitaleaceae bacterium]
MTHPDSNRSHPCTKIIKNGIFTENPIFVQVLGMCPVLAITTSTLNGISMGAATTAVLTFSNIFISILRKAVPTAVRIPIFVVIIAGFVTIVEFLLRAYVPGVYSALGIYIPLIVVNCIILGRAENFASKHNPLRAAADGVGMGLGFAMALIIVGAFREILGSGTFLSGTPFMLTLPPGIPRTILIVLPPGGFLTLGFVMAIRKHILDKKKTVKVAENNEFTHCLSKCSSCK